MKCHPVFVALGAFALIACDKSPKPAPATTPPPATSATPAADVATPEAPPDASKAEAPDAGKVETAAKLIPTTTKSKEALAEFEAGEALLYDLRGAEGMARMKKALELDPDFVQAQATIGGMTPGAAGLAQLEKAAAAAAATNLPEAERSRIEAMLADRRGEDAKATELEKKVVELAPDDWRGYVDLGMRARRANDLAGEIAANTKAAELNPTVGSIHNSLGYAHLLAGNKDTAIEEFKKYTALSPTEPNPYDSLAEALLAAGKLAESEASFQKALEVSPSFSMAWGGVAACRALGGDWKGAQEASAKALEGAMLDSDRADAQTERAWLMAAAGDVAGAVAAFGALEDETMKNGDVAAATFAGVQKTFLLLHEKKLAEADGALAATLARLATSTDTSAQMAAARRWSVGARAMLAARQGKADDAKKYLAELEELTKAVPGRAMALSFAHAIRGAVLLESDAKAAVPELAACLPADAVCKWFEVRAREETGDKDGAAAAKQKIVDTPQRSMGYVYVRARLGTIPTAVK